MTNKKTSSQDATDIRIINSKLDYIQEDVKEIKAVLRAEYVTKDQFDPVKRLVYGTVTLILTSFGLAILALVLRSK